MALHVEYVDSVGKRTAKDIEGTTALIGKRDATTLVDINLPWDATVSRRHARFFYDLGVWHLEQLAEDNLTIVQVEGQAPVTLVPGVAVELPVRATIVVGRQETKLQVHQPNLAQEIMPPGDITPQVMVDAAPIPAFTEKDRLELAARLEELTASDEEALLRGIAAEMKRRFPAAHSGGIALYHDKNFFIPPSSFYPAGRAEISFTLARRALTLRRPLLWDKATPTTTLPSTSLGETVQALYVPILRGAQTVGVLYLHARDSFKAADKAALNIFADTLSALANFRPESFGERMPSVFISYSHRDAEFVRKLVNDLRRLHVRVWIDEQLHAGQNWEPQLEQAIRRSDAFALVMSPESLASEWVRRELEIARGAGKRVFPLLYKPCDPAPLKLDKPQWIDLAAHYVEGVLELADELHTLLERRAQGGTPPPIDGKVRVLFLAANPRDTTPLRLGEEIRTIKERLREGTPDHFELIQEWAVRVGDLAPLLLRHKPHIVHFSGHGASTGAIYLEDETGRAQPVPASALAALFGAINDDPNTPDRVRLVVMNACFTAEQGDALAQHVDCVVGMSRAVRDDVAIAFSGGFYLALSHGKSINSAFNLGHAEVQMLNVPDQPRLLSLTLDPKKLTL